MSETALRAALNQLDVESATAFNTPTTGTSIVFGSKRQRDKLKAYFPPTILGSPLCPAELVKNLGVWFDSNFSLSKHFQNVCKSCFVQLRDFRHVRRFLLMMLLYWPMLL